MSHIPVVKTPSDSAGELSERARRVQQAVKTWIDELIDLGGRNTLLYYRDLKQGTLDLGPDSGANEVAVAELLSDRPSRLSQFFDDSAISAAARRARTIKAKADENYQERGLQTLFLAVGMATWLNSRSTATPAAPILLRQASLAARGGAAEDFDLTLPGEWEVNPTLLHLLRTEHQINVDPDELLALFDDDALSSNLRPLLQRFSKTASSMPGLAVSPRIVLGNFSYAKLPMVLDLQTATDALIESDLICAIAGDEEARGALRRRHPSVTIEEPNFIPPADEFLVLDADASQSYAVNAAVQGADLVIDGPPGTGKSQTIANLIATLSARGQRILFVAEKRAAIDAVLDRLNRARLGELVLDLHEGAGPKRKLAADLARSLSAAATLARPDMSAAQQDLVRHRNVLVDRAEALHTPRDPWGISAYTAFAELSGIPEAVASAQRLRGAELQRMTVEARREARADFESFVVKGGLSLSAVGAPWASAFAAGTISTPESAAASLETVTKLANQTLPSVSARLEAMFAKCGLQVQATVEAWGRALALLEGITATLDVFEPTVLERPLEQLVSALAPADAGALGRLSARLTDGKYRQARKSALELWRGRRAKPSSLRSALAAANDQAEAWQGYASAGAKPQVPSDLAEVAVAYAQLRTDLGLLERWLGVVALDELSREGLVNLLQHLLSDTQTLSRIPELGRLRVKLSVAGLWPLINEIAARNLDIDQALACFDHVFFASVSEAVSVADPRIGAFDGQAHSRTVEQYRKADRDHIQTAAVRVRRAVAEKATRTRDEYPKESELIQHQARLKRGHLPVRQLFQAAPHVLGTLKPCWAMSPLVVSQLLPPQRCFDVVIFDEASQVTPPDAVGALMRAERAIVAGDPHQLPPTSFFMTSGGGEDDEDAEAEVLGAQAGTRNMESVLDVMGALLPPPNGTRTLSWHYRSKDERLIAFSNAQPNLYDWSLTTFPGIAGGACLAHKLVPFVAGRVGQEDSVADEVARVVELVIEHARERPDESLGVIAMGIKHANRIENALRLARRDDDDLDAFLSGAASVQLLQEPFFIKNLERVQGDERDSIILTIGYGKTADGRMLYRFGPINREGGERRLNVAITRARAHMTLVSSFSARDMDPNRMRSEGAKMLWRYLAYAESGGSDLGNVVKEKPDLNPFERDVHAQLTTAGIPLVAQYGCSPYWIDYAAQHPTRPGEMVLAIECDGASYHSSATARDRDRLRQEHLERLGWTFHRIWSQDWFFHREAQIALAVAAYQAAVKASISDVVEEDYETSEMAASPHRPTLQAPDRHGLCPVRTHRDSIDEFEASELVMVVRWIESDTLLRTEDELLAETITTLGFKRRGSKITSAIRAAIGLARNPGGACQPL